MTRTLLLSAIALLSGCSCVESLTVSQKGQGVEITVSFRDAPKEKP